MLFRSGLRKATMLRRYKRFFVDVRLPDGTCDTIHCANTGAMSACVYPGSPVYFSISESPKRKLRGSLELIRTPENHLVCVNTSQANRLVKEALESRAIDELNKGDFRSEVGIPDEAGRFDFGNDEVFVEVKNVTYLRDNMGVFPDAKSARATKHVNALRRCVDRGHRAVLLFCVAHTGIDQMAVADDIDPAYDAAVREAVAAGVEVLAYRCEITPKKLELDRPVPFLGSSSTVA